MSGDFPTHKRKVDAMPKCSEGYVSKRIAALMESLDVHGITEIAANLKESSCGSSDKWDDGQAAQAAEIIKFYLDHWVENLDKDSPMSIRLGQYDRAVKDLILAAYKVYVEDRRIHSNIPTQK